MKSRELYSARRRGFYGSELSARSLKMLVTRVSTRCMGRSAAFTWVVSSLGFLSCFSVVGFWIRFWVLSVSQRVPSTVMGNTSLNHN